MSGGKQNVCSFRLLRVFHFSLFCSFVVCGHQIFFLAGGRKVQELGAVCVSRVLLGTQHLYLILESFLFLSGIYKLSFCTALLELLLTLEAKATNMFALDVSQAFEYNDGEIQDLEQNPEGYPIALFHIPRNFLWSFFIKLCIGKDIQQLAYTSYTEIKTLLHILE